MLSRIARGLCQMGRDIERAQNVIRILEVNHKMHLEREALRSASVWVAIADAFGVETLDANEAALYAELVLSETHPFSVRRCIASARGQGRSMRDHISEEMWLHLNRYHLELTELRFESIVRKGRSEFNREVETFCDAFHGLADNTMVRGPAWYFLRIGKFLERAQMSCRILDVKRKTLELAPQELGRPLDVHQWQSLLRSLSGYEPYRRVYDARIRPERVLEFVLKNPDFPRALLHSLIQLCEALRSVTAAPNRSQADLLLRVDELALELRQLDTVQVLADGGLERYVRRMLLQCDALARALEEAYFNSFRPTLTPMRAAPGASLQPQQQQQ
jgi:uncharacterized alpha-E superfamily protein